MENSSSSSNSDDRHGSMSPTDVTRAALVAGSAVDGEQSIAVTPLEEPPAEQEVGDLAQPGATLQLLRVFRHRNYRLFFAGQLVSLMGTWMQNVAQSWLVYSLTHSTVLLGLT